LFSVEPFRDFQLLLPKPRGAGLPDVESTNTLLDSDLFLLLAVPGGA